MENIVCMTSVPDDSCPDVWWMVTWKKQPSSISRHRSMNLSQYFTKEQQTRFFLKQHWCPSAHVWVVYASCCTLYGPKRTWTPQQYRSFRFSTRFNNLAAGICSHPAARAWVRSNTDVGRLGLAVPKVLDGVEVSALWTSNSFNLCSQTQKKTEYIQIIVFLKGPPPKIEELYWN